MLKAAESKAAETTVVLDGLRRLVQALREGSRAAEAALGLSGARLFVLKAVAETPSASLSDVADRTHTHQSSVSAVVKRLVEAGLLSRRRSADDARQHALTVTARGQRLLSKAPHAAQDRLIGAIDALPAAQRRLLGATLSRLAEATNLTSGAPQMFFEDRKRS